MQLIVMYRYVLLLYGTVPVPVPVLYGTVPVLYPGLALDRIRYDAQKGRGRHQINNLNIITSIYKSIKHVQITFQTLTFPTITNHRHEEVTSAVLECGV